MLKSNRSVNIITRSKWYREELLIDGHTVIALREKKEWPFIVSHTVSALTPSSAPVSTSWAPRTTAPVQPELQETKAHQWPVMWEMEGNRYTEHATMYDSQTVHAFYSLFYVQERLNFHSKCHALYNLTWVSCFTERETVYECSIRMRYSVLLVQYVYSFSCFCFIKTILKTFN